MARPGVMIYFDVREPLEELTDNEKGQLFDAILEYGQYGVIPEFTGTLRMAWRFIKPNIDRDGNKYEKTVQQRKYASYCNKLKALKREDEKVSFDTWMGLTDADRQRLMSVDAEPPPTTTPTTTTATTTATTTTTKSSLSTTPSSTSVSAATPTAEGDFNQRRQQQMERLRNYQGQ